MLEYTCQRCGKIFKRRKGYSGPGKYCSTSCARIDAAPRGTKHPRWKGGVSDRPHSARKAIAERLKVISQCERCGSSDKLQGHHKKSYSNHPELRCDPSNIKILCAACHSLEHPKQKKFILSRVDILQK